MIKMHANAQANKGSTPPVTVSPAPVSNPSPMPTPAVAPIPVVAPNKPPTVLDLSIKSSPFYSMDSPPLKSALKPSSKPSFNPSPLL